jgi:putative membrane protein
MEYFADYGRNHMMDGGNWGWGIIMMLFWAAVLLLVVLLVAKNLNGNNKVNGSESALSIAQQRYAKGDITKKQFDEIKKDLK